MCEPEPVSPTPQEAPVAQFTEAINEAIAEAQAQLAQASAAGDDELVMVCEGRLEGLRRIAAENGVELLSA